MNVKIQSRGIAGGKNTGSCSGYVNYLEHENKEKEEAGMEDQQIPFFDSDGSPVTKAEVIESLDSNVSQLHRDDAKFYSVILSFSEEEVEAMGQSRDEVLSNAHVVVERAMDLYARNFECDNVSSHSDVKYYYTIHECRGESEPGLHVHIAVSRKDATNTYKLSPMTNHRGGSSGVIKRGFNRDAYYRSCEQMFDKSFAFDRSLDRSYDYYNTMKHGSLEQRESMIREVVKQNQLIQQINEAILRRVESLAAECHVPEYQQQYMREAMSQSEERRNMNSFWNSYHSYYKPMLSSVKEACGNAFDLYKTAKADYGVCSEKISDKYGQLKAVYSEIDRLQGEIKTAKTSKLCIKLFSLLIAAVNPAPAIILALTGCIVAEAQKNSTISQIKELRSYAKSIKADIERLKDKQENLKLAKEDTLKAYIEVKDEKENLKSEINALKDMLENSSPVSKETLQGLGKLISEGGLMDKLDSFRQPDSRDYCVSVVQSFLNAEDKLSLELDLLTKNLGCTPVYHPNGGVADFKISCKGQECYASQVLKAERVVQMLDKWENLTGQKPAYKITAELEEIIAARYRSSGAQRRQQPAQQPAQQSAQQTTQQSKQQTRTVQQVVSQEKQQPQQEEKAKTIKMRR